MAQEPEDDGSTVMFGRGEAPDAGGEEEQTQRLRKPEAPPEKAESATATDRAAGRSSRTDSFGDLQELARAPAARLGEGDTIKGRFVLKDRLGAGGMGTVYQALDLRKQEAQDRSPFVAIKVLNEDFRTHPESVRSLQREAKRAQSLAHPNIATVYDFDRDGTSIYMTMELLVGQPLNKILRAPEFHGMPVEEALRIVGDIGAALAYAHEKKIVHCDLKPGNVFVTEEGQSKVFDFGIARASKTDNPDAEKTLFDAGSLGALTPSYASPEMLEGGDPDPRDDIYALACITYELLTGRHPFNRMSALAARDNELQPKRPPTLNRRQWTAIQRGLALERQLRTATVKQFLGELNVAGPSLGQRFAYVGAVAAVVLVAGGVGGYFFMFAQPGPEVEVAKPVAPPAVVVPPPAKPEPEPPKVVAPPTEVAPPPVPVAPPAEVTPALPARPPVETVAPPAEVTPALPARPPPETVAPPAEVTAALPARPPAETVAPPVPALPPEPAVPSEREREQLAVIRPPDIGEIQPLLINMPCARLEATISNGDVQLRGYAQARSDLSRLRHAILSIPGVQDVRSEIREIADALCPPIDFFRPYMATNETLSRGLSIRAKNGTGDYKEGQKLVVDFTGPDYQSHIYVDYFTLDGYVVHLLPQRSTLENRIAARGSGTLGAEGSPRQWTIAPPFGTEALMVLATPQSIFDAVREEVEKQEDYLPALRQQLENMTARVDRNRITADVFFITTRKR
jgi:serine/threonine protein kinase